MKDKEEFFLAPSENIEGKKDKKLWYWEECMKIAADSGAKLGSLVFWVVYKISVYEEHGKFDFCTAGPARLAEDLGVSEKQIRWALQRACSTSVWQEKEKKPKEQQLYHIFCSQRVYRNKTDIYVTKHWLEKHNIKPDKISILAHNKHPEQRLDREDGRYKILPVEGELVEKSVVLDDEDANETTPKSVVFDETTPKSVDTTPKSVVGIEVDLNRNKLKRMSESLNKLKSSKEDGGEPPKDGVKQDKRNPLVEAAYEQWDLVVGKAITARKQYNRWACNRLIKRKDVGLDKVLAVLPYVKQAEGVQFAPQVRSFEELEQKWDKLQSWIERQSLNWTSPSGEIEQDKDSASIVEKENSSELAVLQNPAFQIWTEVMGVPLSATRVNDEAGQILLRKCKGEDGLRKVLRACLKAKQDPKADFRARNIANLSDLQKNWDYVIDWARQQVGKQSKPGIVDINQY